MIYTNINILFMSYGSVLCCFQPPVYADRCKMEAKIFIANDNIKTLFSAILYELFTCIYVTIMIYVFIHIYHFTLVICFEYESMICTDYENILCYCRSIFKDRKVLL